MATSPVYPSGPFSLNHSISGANATAEITLASDAQLYYICVGVINTATVTILVTNASGLIPITIASAGGAPGNITLEGSRDAYKITLTNGGVAAGSFPVYLPAGCKIQAVRDSTNAAITLHVSGLYSA